MSYGQGVERIFLNNSKVVNEAELVRSYKVRRAQLFYLGGLGGAAVRLKKVDRETGKART